MDSISAASTGSDALLQQVAYRVLAKQHEVESKQGDAVVALIESAKDRSAELTQSEPGRLDRLA